VSDHARNTTGEPPDASEVAEAAEIVLGWPYPPQTVLPQRWAVSSWGEACWTYMAMWAPKALSRLEARTPNVALFFHELGDAEADAPDVALVEDVRREHLERR